MITTVALEQGAAFLQVHGSPSARLDAEVLLAQVLGATRVTLYAYPERALSPKEEAAYQSFLERRARREPVSYILGRKEFFGLTMALDRRVLIPRPETELLVERTLACAQALGRSDLRIADIGTGSGCIAIALAGRLAAARVYATDLSSAALEVAGTNLRQHNLAGRVVLLQGDLCAPLPEAVDLLVANPPYTVWAELPPGITAYEPRLALDGGADGLVVYRRLLPQASSSLRPGGYVLLEVGDGQRDAVLSLAESAFPGARRQSWPDLSGWPRVVEIGPVG